MTIRRTARDSLPNPWRGHSIGRPSGTAPFPPDGSASKFPVVSLAQPARAGDTLKPLLDCLRRLFQHMPVFRDPDVYEEAQPSQGADGPRDGLVETTRLRARSGAPSPRTWMAVMLAASATGCGDAARSRRAILLPEVVRRAGDRRILSVSRGVPAGIGGGSSKAGMP
jgi:hypothetical protein